MTNTDKELPLFKVFFTIGIVVLICGIAFIMVDVIINSFTEGLRELGERFAIGGILSLAFAFLYKYHKPLGFVLHNIKIKITKQDKFSEWGKP